jgi:hypothetical protein
LLLALAIAVILGSESQETDDCILLPQIRDSPSIESQVPVFMSPRNRVAQLYPQALDFLFITSYDSQGYGGGIRTRLHARVLIRTECSYHTGNTLYLRYKYELVNVVYLNICLLREKYETYTFHEQIAEL